MDPESRIAELESRINELTQQVEGLLQTRTSPEGEADSNAGQILLETNDEPDLVENMRRRVERALDSEDPAGFEAFLGTVWLSRLTVFFTMSALAFLARSTLDADSITPLGKIGIGYGLAAVALSFGFYNWRNLDHFAQAIMGCGLAALYFTTYGAFFIPEMQFGPGELWGIAPMMACLILLVTIAHIKKSETVAGVGLFLAFYTVVASSITEPTTLTHLLYSLSTCAALAVITLIFHFFHRWLLFSWAALIATHASYLYFFLQKPPGINITDTQYFWVSNGFLAVCYVLFSLTAIVDARKTGEYRKTVAPMAGVNSFIFFALTWFSIRAHYLEHEWIFRTAFAVMLLSFAILAETTGPRRNYLVQIFLAKTVIMITLALQSWLSGEKLLVAMAIECIGLGFSYKRSGIVMFKVLGLGLALITFVGAIALVKSSGIIPIFGYEVPANWFSAVGVAFVFCLTACFYEKFVRRFGPEQRTVSGQWFLADSTLDVPSSSIAILHATGAALILLTITILELGDSPMLPFILLAQSGCMAFLGLLLFTAQIEIGAVLLLAAAHVCYHIFLWYPREGFEAQHQYVPLTLLLALFTYIGAHAWERFLSRIEHADAEWEHHFVASLPYLAATFMLTTLAYRELEPIIACPVQGALGVFLLSVGVLTRYTCVKASGLLALALAGGTFFFELYKVSAPLSLAPQFPLYAGLLLLCFIGAERMIKLMPESTGQRSRLDNPLRTALVFAAVVLGVLGLWEWSPQFERLFYMLGLAVIAITLGAAFRESRYRWAALFLFAIVTMLAFMEFREHSNEYLGLAFGAIALVMAVVSYAYARSGRKPPEDRPSAASPKPASPSDG